MNKKTLFTLVLILFQLSTNAQTLMQQFESIVKRKATTHSMMTRLKAMPYSSTRDAYIGAVTVCKAQEVSNPFTMYQYFKDGTKILEAAIKQDPSNVEAIFLRHAIQMKSPSFLGYTKSIKGDKIFLNNAIKNNKVEDEYLRDLISRFIKDYKI